MALLRKENVRLRAVHLIDTAYGGEKYRKSAVRAQRLFAGWFQEPWKAWKMGRDVHVVLCFVCWVLQYMEINLQAGKRYIYTKIYVYLHMFTYVLYNNIIYIYV